jgi:MFS family permease
VTQLGLRANAPQFTLLVGLNALVGAMVGLERSVLPIVGRHDFGLSSNGAVLTFIVAFGATKALTNLAAGTLADRVGRRRLLALGWLLALPVPLLIGLAPNWGVVVLANLFLGASQGFAWSMTVVMKIDLVGPRRRGLALGLNESAGYLGVALAAAPDSRVYGSNSSDLGGAGAIGRQVERRKPPRERVVQVVDEAGLGAGAQDRVAERDRRERGPKWRLDALAVASLLGGHMRMRVLDEKE